MTDTQPTYTSERPLPPVPYGMWAECPKCGLKVSGIDDIESRFGFRKIMARPFLRWAGGKTKLVEDIVTHMRSKPLDRSWTVRPGERYIEPFVGGAGAYLGLCRHGMIDRERVVLADINEVLIVTLSAIADEGTREDVIRMLSDMETEFENDPAGYYYERRGYLNKSIIPSPGKDRVETAAHMIFINKTCFNGLWRVNSRGEMNTPLGRSPSGKTQILDKGGLMEFGFAVNGAEL